MIKEELTTSMHEEFIGKEISHSDLMIMATYGAMKRGVSKEKALSKYSLTEKEYDDKIKKILGL